MSRREQREEEITELRWVGEPRGSEGDLYDVGGMVLLAKRDAAGLNQQFRKGECPEIAKGRARSCDHIPPLLQVVRFDQDTDLSVGCYFQGGLRLWLPRAVAGYVP